MLGLTNTGRLLERHLLNSALRKRQALLPQRLKRLTLHLPSLTLGPQRAKVRERVGTLTLGTMPILQSTFTCRKPENLRPAHELLPVANLGKCLSLRWKVVQATP